MLQPGMSKSEIEQELEGRGNFIQANELNEFLKNPMTMEMKKFVLMKLADVYEKMKMLKEAAKTYSNAAIVSIAFSEKIKFYVKETEAYIRADAFDSANSAMKKAMVEANSMQKGEIYLAVKEIYKKQAETYERNDKRVHAVRCYEKLLQMQPNDIERKEIQQKLLPLYDSLGRREDYLELKRKIL